MRVTIVGGGIGGAIAARVLREHHEVTILERSTSTKDLGSAINIGPHNVKFLDALGFDRRRAGACPLTHTQAWTKDGRPAREDDAAGLLAACGGPWLSFHRGDLRAELLRLATCPSADLGVAGRPARLVPGARVTAVDVAAGAVRTACGARYDADLVVAADGIRSVVRPLVVGGGDGDGDGDGPPPGEPRPSGRSVYRFALPAGEAVAALPWLPRDRARGACLTMVLADDDTHRSLVIYPCRDFAQFNCGVVLPDALVRTDPGEHGSAVAPTAEMVAACADFGDDIKRFLSVPEQVQLWQLRHQEPLPTYVRGRVLLLGDAAHAMTPLQGQGANSALEDAEGLRLFNAPGVTPDQVGDIARRWESVRRPRASRVQQVTVEAATQMRPDNAFRYLTYYWGYPGIEEGLRRVEAGLPIVDDSGL